ncbi:adhesion G-protein coupled receptor G6 isoform X4 [Gadus morhua]|uniref:adhesion G-protein coupled receptor G6 isoform X4 n=1 Tax=Gadus morhua TaxID=8049 RepID=UPI0011B47A75|nr:adhesion G-protein coupled receptor G6 isoform X4 [Gadus morhua]
MELYPGSGRWRWRIHHVLPVALLWISLHSQVLACGQSDCVLVLTEAQGEFSSPCYPQHYPKSLACKWTMQAPTGFIIQLSFLDFDLEEALGCIYDRVLVNTGSAEVRLCGLTAHGLTLNSTGSLMELSFNSDFSVQKKGFRVSYHHVAVALRNQKVQLSGGKSSKVARSVSIPTMSHMTTCFEVAGTAKTNKESVYFVYSVGGEDHALCLRDQGRSMELLVDGEACDIQALFSSSDLGSSMQPVCLTWTSTSGLIAVSFKGSYRTATCPDTVGAAVPAGGELKVGGKDSISGEIYNFRLWDYAMTAQQLAALTCDAVGSVVDWDTSHWDIARSQAVTDATLSCICFPNCIHLTAAAPTSGTSLPNDTTHTTNCDSSGLGCPASTSPTNPSSTDSTNIIHATNVISHAIFPIPPSLSIVPTTSMPLTPPSNTSTTSSNSSSTISTTTIPARLSSPSSALTPASDTSTLSSATTNPPATNPPPPHEGLFYRVSFVVEDEDSELDQGDLELSVLQWLNETFESWSDGVYIDYLSVLAASKQRTSSYTLQALLVYSHSTNDSLGEALVSSRLSSSGGSMGRGLQLQTDSIQVKAIEHCPEESPLHYRWPKTRPTTTQHLPCFPNKEVKTSRTCMISSQNLSSYWSPPDLSNCTDIDNIELSAENAAEVAVQLADITNNALSDEEVSKVVTKVKELVNLVKVNFTLASTVVTIISNIMTGSESMPAAASEKVLRTVDDLVQKIEFEGPSVMISSRHLAVAVSALNASSYNGTSFSASIPPNNTDPQINFETDSGHPLAQVTLPASLLTSDSLSEAERDTVDRINFMFFSKNNFFQGEQDGLSLNSYVVASSVGNQSISNLPEPIEIHITHLFYQPSPNPVCMFWDFTMKDGDGGWNREGCRVSPLSNHNKTVCLCDHLTHFGILMDISGAAPQIDQRNTKILTFITYIGCGVSAIFSAATLLTYIAFEKLRRDYPSKILMNLSTSLLFLNMVFLLDGWLASMDADWLCVSVAVFLHYFLLTTFTWMGLESIHMYIALVKVFNTYIRRYILKFCLVGWGLPAVLVSVVVAVDRKSYGRQEYGRGSPGEETQGSSEFCWIQSPVVFYITCVGYFCLVFLMNVAMFVVVMQQICGRNGKRSNRTLREEVLRNLRSVISLTFLLGMTWGFALFAWGPVNVAFMYLFAIFNSLQGLFIFVFHCALKENVQKQWRRYLCCGKLRLADNSDWSKTPTNNTKKVSSENLGKSLSSSSFSSTTATWTSKAKATLYPFNKRHSNTGKGFYNQASPKCASSCSSSSEAETPPSSSSNSILPVSQMIDKVKGYCSTRSDNFYKNIILSDSFSNSTKF